MRFFHIFCPYFFVNIHLYEKDLFSFIITAAFPCFIITAGLAIAFRLAFVIPGA